MSGFNAFRAQFAALGVVACASCATNASETLSRSEALMASNWMFEACTSYVETGSRAAAFSSPVTGTEIRLKSGEALCEPGDVCEGRRMWFGHSSDAPRAAVEIIDQTDRSIADFPTAAACRPTPRALIATSSVWAAQRQAWLDQAVRAGRVREEAPGTFIGCAWNSREFVISAPAQHELAFRVQLKSDALPCSRVSS